MVEKLGLSGRSYALFMRAAMLGDTADLRVAINAWGDFCTAAEFEIGSPRPLTDSAGLASMSANGRLRRADFFELLGESAVAAVEREAARGLIAAYGEPAAQLEVRRTLANSLRYQARYGEALAEFAALEAALDPEVDPVTYARVALDRAILLEWLGDFDRAEAELALVEQRIADRLDTTPAPEGFLATVLGAMADASGTEERVALQSLRMEIGLTRATAAKRSNRLAEAKVLFESLRANYQAWGTEAAIDFHLMHIEALSGEVDAAVARLHGLDAQMRSDPRFHTKIPVLHWVAAEAMVERSPQWALDRINEGLPTVEHAGDLEVLWKMYWTAAKSLTRLGRHDEATERFLEAARAVDKLRRVPLGYRLESTYFADRRPLFDQAVEHAAAHRHAAAALELTELAKSRNLATLVYGARLTLGTDPRSLQIDDLSRQLDAWDFRSFNGDQVDPLVRRRMAAERTQAIQQIRVADPQWRSLTEPLPISVESIVDSLDGALAISLFITNRTIVAVSVGNDGVEVDSRVVHAATWHEIDAYCANVRRAEDPWAYDLSGFGEVALNDLLPSSTIARLLSHDRAVIVGHGKLHLVPWSALEIEGQRLFQHVGVTMMPNLMCLAAAQHPWPELADTWIVGAPDYTTVSGLETIDPDRSEYESLRTIWQTASGTRPGGTIGAQSTETAMRIALGGDHDLVHISCHGSIDHDEPSSSALIAADGKVDAAEIALGGACAEEVVLGACSTGYRSQTAGGVALSGDDVVGLPAAFLEAGARSILMSIPEAHDATATEFMTRYHQHRAAPMAPVDAFRATQIAMLEVQDPALWCGFVMYGSPSRLTAARATNKPSPTSPRPTGIVQDEHV